MLNQSTLPHLRKIHQEVVHDMKCSRHDIHPMYPADFASQLNVLTLAEMKRQFMIYWISEMKIFGCYLVLCLCFHA